MYIIYIFNPLKILFCNISFHEDYNNIHQCGYILHETFGCRIIFSMD